MLDYHKKVSIYHGLPEELKMTATMVALKLAPAVRKSNSGKIEQFEKKEKVLLQCASPVSCQFWESFKFRRDRHV